MNRTQFHAGPAWRRVVVALALASIAPPAYAAAQAPASPAQDVDPKLIPNLSALSAADLARAEALLDKALPLIVAAQFDRSLPLVTEARTIYDKAWPKAEYLTRPMVDQDAVRKTALALGPDRAHEAEVMARYALLLDFEHGRDETYFEFSGLDADQVAALALILHRRKKDEAATRVLRLLAQSSDYNLRASAGQTLLDEVARLRAAGDKAGAERTARFATTALGVPAMAKDRLFAEISASLADLLKEGGSPEEAAKVLQAQAASGTVEQSYAAANEVDAMLLRLFRDGEEERAKALLAQVTASPPGRLNLAAADKLDALARDLHDAAQEERMRRLALTIYERELTEKDGRLNRATNALANTYALLHRLDDAERYYRRALALSQRAGGVDSLGTIDDTRALAGILARLARPAEAEALLRRVWAMTEPSGDLADFDYLKISTDLTDVLLDQGKIEEADRLTDSLLQRVDAAAGLKPLDRVQYYLNRARVLARLERHPQAEQLLRKAQGMVPPAPPRKPGEVGDIDFNFGYRSDVADALARALEAQGKYAEAEPLRRPFVENMSLDGTQADSTIRIGADLASNLSQLKRTAEAEALFSKLSVAARKVFGAESEQAAYVSRAAALHQLRSGEAAGAIEPARAALSAWAALETRISASAGEAAYLARIRQQKDAAWLFARTAASAQNSAGLAAEIFEALQRSEITAAGAALSRRAARESATAAGAAREVATWQKAQSELARIDAQIAQLAGQGEAGDAERLRQLDLRQGAEQRLLAAERELARTHSRFFDLIASRPLKLQALQGGSGLLRPDEALILLAPGSSDLPEAYRNGLVQVVTREGTAWAEIPLKAGELEKSVYILHQQLAAPGTGETLAPGEADPSITYSRERAHALYKALFGDARIAALLDKKERWTLAPQGALISLPFAALVTAPPPGGAAADADPAQLRKTEWLGLKRILAVIPSVPSLAIHRAGKGRPIATAQRSPFFGLGDPAFRGVPDPAIPAEAPATDGKPQVSRAPNAIGTYFRGAEANLAALASLDRLPGTAGEIKRLAQTLGGAPDSVLLQMDANEAELRRRNASGALKSASVVAFATHGLIGGELTNEVAEPALALTPPPAAGGRAASPDNDGLLTASEAASLDLSARWLILSACNTAAAGGPNSESLSGLARAFLYAGAQSLLVSHFPVFDDAAPHLTGEAVRIAGADKLDPPAAMRQAMIRLVANGSNDAIGYSFAHPKAWAAFAVIDAN